MADTDGSSKHKRQNSELTVGLATVKNTQEEKNTNTGYFNSNKDQQEGECGEPEGDTSLDGDHYIQSQLKKQEDKVRQLDSVKISKDRSEPFMKNFEEDPTEAAVEVKSQAMAQATYSNKLGKKQLSSFLINQRSTTFN